MRLVAIVSPVFLLVALGWALRRWRFLGAGETAWLSRFVYYVAAPALLLRSTAGYDFAWGQRGPMLLAVAGLTALVALLTLLAAAPMAPARRGVFAQGCHRSNTVFVGLPVVLGAYGESALGVAAVVVALMVVVENLLSVLVLTLPHEKLSARDPAVWKRAAWRVLLNPLALSCGAGLIAAFLDLGPPAGLDGALAMLGAAAAPLGLLVIGADLDFGRLRAELPVTAVAGLVRLLVHPAITYAALRAMDLRGAELGVPVLIMACPTAVISTIMAREMQGDARLAGAIVVGTTAASLVTLLGWLAFLGLR